jgi:hypothetical protein
MKEKDFVKWEKIRAKGTLHFIVFGTLKMGSVWLITLWLYHYLIGKFYEPLFLDVIFKPYFIMLFLTVCYGGGLFWAMIVWGWSEYGYQISIGNNTKIPFWVPKQTNKLK